MGNPKYKIVIAEENNLLREGLRHLINSDDSLECIEVADDLSDATEKCIRLSPDIIIADASSNLEVAEWIKIIHNRMPQIAIAILVSEGSFQSILNLLEAGANAVLSKDDTNYDNLFEVFKAITKGYTVIRSDIISDLIQMLQEGKYGSTHSGVEILHYRELQVLKLAGKGLSNKEISSELGISSNTVGTHFINIYRKLGVQSRTEAVLTGLKQQLFTLEELS